MSASPRPGASLARRGQAALQSLVRPHAAEARGEPTLGRPVSQACTEAQVREPAYAYWCGEIREPPRTHRKQWEFCYILQALATRGKLAPQMRGLGFGVGEEPLTAVFARRGVEVTATDLAPERAVAAGWADHAQLARGREELNSRGICPAEAFDTRVGFRHVDMNAVPADLAGFDFTWSACALEHLGSIADGAAFILRSLDTLGPGGVAVHTTELNVADGPETLDDAGTVLFRRRDLQPILDAARRKGFRCTANWSTGEGELDRHVDVPPYSSELHLKLQIAPYVTTSFGLILERQ